MLEPRASIAPRAAGRALRRGSLRGVLTALLAVVVATPANSSAVRPQAVAIDVEELRLANGMKLLLVRRPDAPTVAAGWIAGVGSADEEPGRRGVSHLLEHLMFKGSRIVGARDLDVELPVLDELDEALAALRGLEDVRPPERAGGRRQERHRQATAAARQRVATLTERARSLAFLGEFSLLYSESGAVGLNAHTLRDLTLYLVTLPAERLELWFWLESDRLLHPVFRELPKEVRVIHEERRLRVGSTPTGRLDEEMRRRFWGEHPYAESTMGRPEDLDRLTRRDASRFFERHYRPSNLTAALVGNFDPGQVRRWAELYFGRLPADSGGASRPAAGDRERGDASAAAASGRSSEADGEPAAPWEASCACPAQARVWYRSVPHGHPDAAALDLVAALMNGRSGRLHRSLVLGREIAFTASARQNGLRRAGYFTFTAESRTGAAPRALVAAWDEELERLRREAISPRELERARNRVIADAFRRLKEPGLLLQQLLIYEGLGGWTELRDWPRRIAALGEAEVRTAANRYLRPAGRTVALWTDERGGDREGREAAAGGGAAR